MVIADPDNFCTKHATLVYADRACPHDHHVMGDAAPVPDDTIYITRSNKRLICMLAELNLDQIMDMLDDSVTYRALRIVYSHSDGWTLKWVNSNKCAFELAPVGGRTMTCKEPRNSLYHQHSTIGHEFHHPFQEPSV